MAQDNNHLFIAIFSMVLSRLPTKIACMKLISSFAKSFAFIFSALLFNNVPGLKATNSSPSVRGNIAYQISTGSMVGAGRYRMMSNICHDRFVPLSK